MNRKITDIAANACFLYARCDDGTVWEKGINSDQWKELPAIPQPEPESDTLP